MKSDVNHVFPSRAKFLSQKTLVYTLGLNLNASSLSLSLPIGVREKPSAL